MESRMVLTRCSNWRTVGGMERERVAYKQEKDICPRYSKLQDDHYSSYYMYNSYVPSLSSIWTLRVWEELFITCCTRQKNSTSGHEYCSMTKNTFLVHTLQSITHIAVCTGGLTLLHRLKSMSLLGLSESLSLLLQSKDGAYNLCLWYDNTSWYYRHSTTHVLSITRNARHLELLGQGYSNS